MTLIAVKREVAVLLVAGFSVERMSSCVDLSAEWRTKQGKPHLEAGFLSEAQSSLFVEYVSKRDVLALGVGLAFENWRQVTVQVGFSAFGRRLRSAEGVCVFLFRVE